MPFNPQSPGVYSSETDVSTVAPAVATTVGAISGIFNWGPLFTPTLINSEAQLLSVFGKPNSNNFETWFSAKNFLFYGQQLFVVRTAMTGAVVNSTILVTTPSNGSVNTVVNSAITAIASQTANVAWSQQLLVTNATYNSASFKNFIEVGGGGNVTNVFAAAKYPGQLGNAIRLGICCDPQQYHSVVNLSGVITGGVSSGNSYNGVFSINPNNARYGLLTFTANGGSNVSVGQLFAQTLLGSFAVGDYIRVPTYSRSIPYQTLQVNFIGNPGTNSTVTQIKLWFTTPYSGGSNLVANTVERYWEFYKTAPPANLSFTSSYQANSSLPTGKDMMSIAIVDNTGYITGTPNTILEVYNGVSRATDAVNQDGTTNYYQTVINQNSPWIWIVNDLLEFPSALANSITVPAPLAAPYIMSMTRGSDGDSETTAPMSTLINGWQLFQGTENVKINLVIAGKSVGSNGNAGFTNTAYGNFGMADWLISNIAEKRKDCVVFFSPDKSIVVNNNLGNDIPTDLVNWAGLISSSDRAFMDCNYKYQYDQYNNVYRWVPLNGDIAGLCVYTDTVAYPWFSPAGFNRGQIANVTRLAWNPQQGDRDFIYPNAINPVVAFPGQGVYLYGDRTFTTQPSAFNRINVRRMFLYAEQSIAIAARYTLFEINDVFTQNQFKNLVTPLLQAIQATRGITDFQVTCDYTVNTPYAIDQNQFLAAILIKPARSINFINITYYAVPDGVAFSTVAI
jgi:hypothetical protein